MDADQRGVPCQPDRALRRRGEGRRHGGRRGAVRRDPPPGDGGRARARAGARRDPHRELRAMRLVTYDNGAGAEAGVLIDQQVVPVSALDAPARSVRGLLERLDAAGLLALGERAATSDERLALASVRLLAPVPDPDWEVTMESKTVNAVEFRDGQRHQWNSAASGWRRWSELIDGAASGISERLVELAGVEPGSRVLDVAAGYGEPSLTAARAAGPEGAVLATDISAEMIAFGRERAAAAGLENIEFVQSDAASLDFPAASFDAALSRWGIRSE